MKAPGLLPSPRTLQEYTDQVDEIRVMVKKAIAEALEKRGWKINFPLDVFVHPVGARDFEIHIDLSLKGE